MTGHDGNLEAGSERDGVGIIVLDHDLCARQANAASAALFGFSEADALGRPLAELMPRLASAIAAPARMVLDTGQAIHRIELASAGKPDERWQVSCHRVELGVAIAVARLTGPRVEPRESDAIFHAIFDHAPISMIVMDWRGGGVRVNRAFCELMGYSEAELSVFSVQRITHPDDFAADVAEFQRLMAGEMDHYRILKRYIRKSGEQFWGQLVVSLARDSDGKPLLVIGMVEDITERRRSEAERERVIETLEQAVRARETFLAVTSHELKTPLTPLILSLQLLKLRVGGSTAEVDVAIQQVERLEALVRTLLDVSTIAAGRLVLTPAELDLTTLVSEVVDSFRGAAERAGSTLSLATPGPLRVSADGVRLQQVVSNLLTNAIKFGAGTPIEVEVSAGGGLARLQVRDRGIGVAEGDRERIFGRFERAASELRYGGLGLGLYVSREIMTAHGGRVQLEPGTSAGSTFVVELPL